MNLRWHKYSVHNMGIVSVRSEVVTVEEGEQTSRKGQNVWSESGILRIKILDKRSLKMTKSENVAVLR